MYNGTNPERPTTVIGFSSSVGDSAAAMAAFITTSLTTPEGRVHEASEPFVKQQFARDASELTPDPRSPEDSLCGVQIEVYPPLGAAAIRAVGEWCAAAVDCGQNFGLLIDNRQSPPGQNLGGGEVIYRWGL